MAVAATGAVGRPRAPTASSAVADLAEAKITDLLRATLYTPEAVARLVDKVNVRLRTREPIVRAERVALRERLARVHQHLEHLRQFVLGGDTSAKVRTWLAEAEQEEARLTQALAQIDAVGPREPVRVHPSRITPNLDDLRGTLARGGVRARQLLHADIDRIVVHQILSETTKPFARAEVISTGKGLLRSVTFVVAGARTHRYQTFFDSRWT